MRSFESDVGACEGEMILAALGLTVGFSLGVEVGVVLGGLDFCKLVGWVVGSEVLGVGLGSEVGRSLGSTVGVELRVGCSDGDTLGFSVGREVGIELGTELGGCDTVGDMLGRKLGVELGLVLGEELGVELGNAETVGSRDGAWLGLCEGKVLNDGAKLGVNEGEKLGLELGADDGAWIGMLDGAGLKWYDGPFERKLSGVDEGVLIGFALDVKDGAWLGLFNVDDEGTDEGSRTSALGVWVGFCVGACNGAWMGECFGACDGAWTGERVGALMGAVDGLGAGGGKNTSSSSSGAEQAESPNPMLTTIISGGPFLPYSSRQTSILKLCPDPLKSAISKASSADPSEAITAELLDSYAWTTTNISGDPRVSLLKLFARLYCIYKSSSIFTITGCKLLANSKSTNAATSINRISSASGLKVKCLDAYQPVCQPLCALNVCRGAWASPVPMLI
jgi:hypothetical protein